MIQLAQSFRRILMKLFYSNWFFLWPDGAMVTDTLHNIVLTEIKIHNMHRSLAFPLDGIRKLVCGKVKDTSGLHNITQISLLLLWIVSNRKYPEKRLYSQRKKFIEF